MSILHNSFSEGKNNMMLGLDDIHELTKVGLTNLDVIGETIQYKDFRIDGEAVSLIITEYLSKT